MIASARRVRRVRRQRSPSTRAKPATLSTVLMWLGTILLSFAGLLSLGAAMMSPMMFDAPGSTEKTYMWVLFGAVLSFPVVCGLGVVLAWIFHSKRNTALAFAMFFLPLLNVLVAVIAGSMWK